MNLVRSEPTQNFLQVTVEQDTGGGLWRVHVRLNRAVMAYGDSHPKLTPREAEALARDVGNAAADALRKNVARNL